MVKRHHLLLIICIWTVSGINLFSQKNDILSSTLPLQTPTDTTVSDIRLDTADLNKIRSLREQFEMQNKLYTAPYRTDNKLLRFLKKNEAELSGEALYWINKVYEPSWRLNTMTFRDTTIVNPMFLPLIFQGGVFPESRQLYELPWENEKTAYSGLFTPDTSFFSRERNDIRFRKQTYRYLLQNHPDYFKYTLADIPTDIPQPKTIKANPFKNIFQVESDTDPNRLEGPNKFLPKIRYWRPYFESSIQFSQSYISPNWHKGGNGNMNLYTRNYARYNYNKDKIQFTNELELKESFYTAPKDTLHEYRIGEDVFRLYSNLGYRAYHNWYYTFYAEFKTQIFTNYAENSHKKLAAFLAPYTLNLGIGMKYEIRKNFNEKGKNIYFSTNLAPVSYTYMYSINDNIDLGRHGFVDGKHYLSSVGSTVRADMTFNINRFTTWTSRFYYFTGYHRIEGEFENTLNLAISRFFSTRINLNLRYDDGVSKKDPSDSYLQVYELLSFGFNYKW